MLEAPFRAKFRPRVVLKLLGTFLSVSLFLDIFNWFEYVVFNQARLNPSTKVDDEVSPVMYVHIFMYYSYNFDI